MKKVSTQLIQWVVLSIFIFSVVFTLYLGADFYQSMNSESTASLNQRSIVLYFNHQFNQADAMDGLVVYDNRIVINNDGYYTVIYEENGRLIEQVSEVDSIMESSGQVIAELYDLRYVENNNQISIMFSDSENNSHELKYTLKSVRGVR